MSCSVYCLVSRLEEFNSLMASLERAGFERERVTVIWRRPSEATPRYLPFMPVAWWWWSVMIPCPGTSAEPQEGRQVVVPYAMVEARRMRVRNA